MATALINLVVTQNLGLGGMRVFYVLDDIQKT